jgi:hypothetical protein
MELNSAQNVEMIILTSLSFTMIIVTSTKHNMKVSV